MSGSIRNRSVALNRVERCGKGRLWVESLPNGLCPHGPVHPLLRVCRCPLPLVAPAVPRTTKAFAGQCTFPFALTIFLTVFLPVQEIHFLP